MNPNRQYIPTHILGDCPSYLTLKEYAKILDLIIDNNFSSYLEVGVMKGGNLVRMSNLLELNGHDCSVTAYDCFENHPQDVGNTHTSGWQTQASVENTVKTVHGFGNVEFVQGLGAEANEKLAGRKFDLIFHDADHSFKGVYEDLKSLRSLVSEGGFVTVHDITYDDERPTYGGGQAVKQLVLEGIYEHVETVDSMGVLR